MPRGSDSDPELTTPEKLFADKYSNGTFVADGRHAWLRIVPEKITGWDFRIIERGGEYGLAGTSEVQRTILAERAPGPPA